MADMVFWSARRLASAIRRRKVGAAELLERYLDRVARYNPALNAIVACDLAGARQRAKAADEALARGETWGPLHGLPMTIKESYDVVGMPTTWGLSRLKDNRPSRNALAVERHERPRQTSAANYSKGAQGGRGLHPVVTTGIMPMHFWMYFRPGAGP